MQNGKWLCPGTRRRVEVAVEGGDSMRRGGARRPRRSALRRRRVDRKQCVPEDRTRAQVRRAADVPPALGGGSSTRRRPPRRPRPLRPERPPCRSRRVNPGGRPVPIRRIVGGSRARSEVRWRASPGGGRTRRERCAAVSVGGSEVGGSGEHIEVHRLPTRLVPILWIVTWVGPLARAVASTPAPTADPSDSATAAIPARTRADLLGAWCPPSCEISYRAAPRRGQHPYLARRLRPGCRRRATGTLHEVDAAPVPVSARAASGSHDSRSTAR